MEIQRKLLFNKINGVLFESFGAVELSGNQSLNGCVQGHVLIQAVLAFHF